MWLTIDLSHQGQAVGHLAKEKYKNYTISNKKTLAVGHLAKEKQKNVTKIAQKSNCSKNQPQQQQPQTWRLHNLSFNH